MRSRAHRSVFGYGLVLAVAGCAQPGLATRASIVEPAPASPSGVVYIVNGSGGSTVLSDHLAPLVREAGLPLDVAVIPWSLHQGILADHEAIGRHEQAGTVLAARIATYRAAHPTGSITLVGHSTGTHVVLLAASSLPENTVDRIVLLAPSVAASYDLLPALRAARCGIDSFCSTTDGVLGVAEAIKQTGDGHSGPTAGRAGFATPPPGSADASLYSRLRQHKYQAGYQLYGNFGGHYGPTRSAFLREVIVPMLTCGPR